MDRGTSGSWLRQQGCTIGRLIPTTASTGLMMLGFLLPGFGLLAGSLFLLAGLWAAWAERTRKPGEGRDPALVATIRAVFLFVALVMTVLSCWRILHGGR